MLDLIKQRRSIRQYTNQDVSDEHVRQLARSGHGCARPAAPLTPGTSSSCATPPHARSCSQTHTFSDMCARAPVVVVVCGDENLSDHWIADGAAATENLLLAVTALGLGAVWVGVYPRAEREDARARGAGHPAAHPHPLPGARSAIPARRSRRAPATIRTRYTTRSSSWICVDLKMRRPPMSCDWTFGCLHASDDAGATRC